MQAADRRAILLLILLEGGNSVDVDLARTIPALASALLAVVGAVPVGAHDSAFIAARDRNPSLKAYSFHVSVAMRMQTFPWLRFHLDGIGNYERGRRYEIQFTRVPFFAQDFKKVDLSALDPTMWQKQFFVQLAGQKNGMTTFELRPRKVDPKEQNPLVSAQVMLDEKDSTRDVVLQYASGEIHMSLNPTQTQGFRLPESSDVDVKLPGRSLSAHVDFTDYTIEESIAYRTSQEATASKFSRLSPSSRDPLFRPAEFRN